MSRINSRTKGKVGEREFAHFLEAHGIKARRGQQFSGSNESPDVVSELPYHLEVKRVERLNLREAIKQATQDCNDKVWLICHRWNNGEWLITIKAEEFLKLVKNTPSRKAEGWVDTPVAALGQPEALRSDSGAS